jgi:hypothetical protein
LEILNINGTSKSLTGERPQPLAKIPLSVHFTKGLQYTDIEVRWVGFSVCTDYYKKFSCVTDVESLKYVQKHNMKCWKMAKIQDRQIAMLKRVGDV